VTERRRPSARLRLASLDPRTRALLRVVCSIAPDAALVGGVVRDAARRAPFPRRGVDLDFTVPRGALAIARRLADRIGGAFLALDDERGAGRVVLGSARLDIADWRAPSLEEDLAARDFTVNALAAPLRPLVREGAAVIVDPTGGLLDLEAERLRPVYAEAFEDDPLRMLRGVRFETTLGLRLAGTAAQTIRAAAPRLGAVAAERQRDELLLLLRAPRAGRALRRLDALGLLAMLFPEVEAMRRTAQPRPHRFDVLEHSLRAVDGTDRLLARLQMLGDVAEEIPAHLAEEVGGGVDRAHVLRLAALLHDVAKPDTRRVVGGRVRFFDHDVRGAGRSRAIGERLRLPGRAVAILERLVRHHLRPMHLARAGEITRRARYRFFRDLAEDSHDLLLLAVVDAAAVTGVSPSTAWRRSWVVRDLMAGWRQERAAASAPPLLRGEDVMDRLGLPPGPAVGALLARVREAQALGLVRTREEALAYLDSSEDDP
jgi:putative nucleotidyltransferase with HDIG domain